MTRVLVALFLIPCLLLPVGRVFAESESETVTEGSEPVRRDGRIVLQGEELFPPKESQLMRELGQEHYHTSRARRFEIVFFISIPITLLLSFSLMEGLSRGVFDVKNPNRDLRQPHYIYMFSTAAAASLYVAIQDARRYVPHEAQHNRHNHNKAPVTEVNEVRFQIPIIGVRF